jgi:lipid II:glycine glycyltransferase (peptidoglycan interpeptide bridge formation enzyme)
LQIRSAHDDLSALDPRLIPDRRYVDFRLDLTGDLQGNWSSPAWAKVRNHIRKAKKAGVIVRPADGERDLRAFYDLHLKTTKRHGMPAQAFSYFQNFWWSLLETCPVQLFLAWHEGRAVAGSVYVGFRDHATYVYNASEPNALAVRPNYLVMWEAICWATRVGFGYLSLGKTSLDNPGLVQFKLGWGAKQVPLAYYYYPLVAGLTSNAYSESRGSYRVITRLWRTLPAPLTNSIGGMIYRHLG